MTNDCAVKRNVFMESVRTDGVKFLWRALIMAYLSIVIGFSWGGHPGYAVLAAFVFCVIFYLLAALTTKPTKSNDQLKE